MRATNGVFRHIGLALLGVGLMAAAPPLPMPRPAHLSRPATTPQMPGVPLPRPRPIPEPVPAPAPGGQHGPAAETTRAPRIYQTACPAVIRGEVQATPLPPIGTGQCGNQSPLSVTGVLVNGKMVKLSRPATLDCQMASSLPAWVSEVDRYLGTEHGARIKSILMGGSYSCRDRRVAGGSADLSEHGRADAVDFIGFGLTDGTSVTVAKDYDSPDPKVRKFMHFAHDAACPIFTTVLGPDANALHHDHFHLDLGCHGKTCTYRICE